MTDSNKELNKSESIDKGIERTDDLQFLTHISGNGKMVLLQTTLWDSYILGKNVFNFGKKVQVVELILQE